jgi:hypothetical protein
MKINNILSVSEFSQQIELMVANSGIPYTDAFILFAEQNNIEIETIASLVKQSSILKAKLQAECEDNGTVKRTANKITA